MDIYVILALVVIALLTVIYIFRPQAGNNVMSSDLSNHNYLQAERDRLVSILRDLDSDYQLEKIPEHEYKEQREKYIILGAKVLKEMDSLMNDAPGGTGLRSSNIKKSLSDDEIEEYIEKRRQKSETSN